ncbi:PepSY domain-containing protein [Celeribacter baekdonensis]|uniref:PepSY domain-containing protein n=1 Tax=Celeribacter baekdonensis TaxID=875171 RepID=UPI003A950222
MLKNILSATLLAATLTTGAFAMGTVELTDANKAKITELLTAEGYDVGKIKLEDGYYEAYAKKDGKKLEVLLDGDFTIVKIQD